MLSIPAIFLCLKNNSFNNDINNSQTIQYIISCICFFLFRGFREKNLHKILSKNRDIICHSMTDPKMNLSESLSQKLQSLVQQSLTTSREQENETAETDKLPVKSEEIPGGSNEMEVESICHSVSDQEDGDDCQPTKTLALPNDDTVVWDPFFPDRINKGFHKIMEYLEGMETRLFDAHLPLEVHVYTIHVDKCIYITYMYTYHIMNIYEWL